jgi:GAF domain-containing protein/HAMP domain-containing protein
MRSYFIIRQFRDFSLRTKMIITFVITAVVSVGIVAYLTNRSLSASLTDGIIDNQTVLANTLASQIGQTVNSEFDKLYEFSITKAIQDRAEAASLAKTFSQDVTDIEQLNQTWRAAVAANNENDPLVAKVLFNSIASELKKFQKAFPENVNVLLTDNKGFSIASTNLSSNFYQADALWWRIAHGEGQYIGQPIYYPDSKIIAFDIAVPIYSNRTGGFVGILHATVNFNVLTSLLANSLLGQTGQAIIYQPTDQYIKLQAIEGGNYEILQGFASKDLKTFNESGNTNIDFLLNDVNVLASRALVKSDSPSVEGMEAVNNLNWHVIVLQEKSEALQPVEFQTRNILLWTLAIALVAAFAAFSLAQSLAGPIIRLNAFAEKATAGDLSVQAEVEANDEIGALAVTFNNMVTQLRNMIGSLEQRVKERTTELAESANQLQKRSLQFKAIAQMAKTITSIQDVETLLPRITQLVHQYFGFYHIGLFLLDESRQYAILSAANSEGGQRMLSRKHRLGVGQTGIVGYVTGTGEPRIALDTGIDAVYFDNPDLPDTRSEMALPLKVGKNIIGALDVQSTEPNAFSEEDVEALSILADEVSIAIENARLFEESQRLLANAQSAFGEFTLKAWQEMVVKRNFVGYEFTGNSVRTLDKPVKRNGSSIAIPIKLREQAIGVMNIALPNNKQLDQDEEDIANALAQRIGIAVESATLLEESRRRAITESMVSEISAKLSASTEVERIMQVVVGELRQALGASEVSFSLSNQEPTSDQS